MPPGHSVVYAPAGPRASAASVRREAPGRSHTNATCPAVLCGETVAVGNQQERVAGKRRCGRTGGARKAARTGYSGDKRGAGPESECVLVSPVLMVGGVVQATTTCHQQWPIVGQSRRAERIASRTARATWGWQEAVSFQLSAFSSRRAEHADANGRRYGTRAGTKRVAGFGRRERRRRRCGGQRVSSGERGKSPIRVNRGLLGRTRPRRGQQLFTCKRRDAREASLPLRCYAESREGPGLHRQPRPGDRRCTGRPPSASVEAGRTPTRPVRRGERTRARVSNRVSRCGVHDSPAGGRCHTAERAVKAGSGTA
jgi:hypothetical protein